MLLLWYRQRKKRLQKEKRRKYWVRPIFKKRKLFGEFHQMLNELRVTDREYFFRYMQMNPERFNSLLSLVQDKIYKRRNTRFRESIPAAERLTVTLNLFICSANVSRCLKSNDPIISICLSIYHLRFLLFFPSLTVVITQLLNTCNFCLS